MHNKIIKNLIVLITVILTLCSCGTKASKDYTQFAKKYISITDDYLDYKISAEEAYNELENMHSRLNGLPKTDVPEDSGIVSECLLIHLNMIGERDSSSRERLSKILEHRNNIAKYIGSRTRR